MSDAGVILLVILTYTYIGYPILIWILARLFPHEPISDREDTPTVTICIATHNGARYLAQKLDSLLALAYDSDKLEILVCSDGSTDSTADILAEYSATDSRIRFFQNQRAGKPTAINDLRNKSSGEILVMTDVRQPLHRDAVRSLVSALSDPAIGCVSGYLEMQGSSEVGLYWRYERWIRKNESTFRSLTGVTGALYAIRREDWPVVPSDIVLDDVWVPISLRLQGRRIILVTEAIAYDAPADIHREFTRKTRTLYGNYQLFWRLPQTLIPWKNPSFFELISHKVLRLLGPWLLLGLAITSLWTFFVSSGAERLAFGILVGAQLCLYILALFGPTAGRFGNLSRTFVVLNASAILAFWHFVRRKSWVMW